MHSNTERPRSGGLIAAVFAASTDRETLATRMPLSSASAEVASFPQLLEHQNACSKEDDGMCEDDEGLHLAIHAGTTGFTWGIGVFAEKLFVV